MTVTPPAPLSRGPLLASKVHAPALHPAWHERERLSVRLDEALLDSTRLAILSAPPGYGKTVAVLGWLGSRRLPHAWLTLDEADDDPARFARYLVAALAAVRPGIGDATLALLGTGSNAGPDLLAATVIDELSAADDPFVLVLDDVQAVSSPDVLRVVRLLVDGAPPFVHLVVLTRVDPPLPLARLRATGRLVEVRPDDLRFSRSEAATHLGAATGLAISEPDLRRLLDRTEGWPAGLHLAALLLRERPDPAAVIDAFHGSSRYVLDYLAGEVLDGLDRGLRDFLVRTSVADRFTVDLARELAGPEAPGLLERAEAANLFLVSLDAERRWFRYHQLFGEYLRTHLSADETRELHRRVAGYLERDGQRREAIDHALAAGAAADAVRLVREEARSAFDAGELRTLLGWLRRLTPEAVYADAELASLGAWSLFLTGELPAAREWAARALAQGDPERPDPRLLIAAAIVAVLADAATDTAEELASRALDLLEDDPFFRSQALLTLGEIRLSQGRLEEAVATMREALDVGLVSGQPMAIFPIAYLLATGMNAVGQRREAEALCRSLLAEHADGRGRPLPIAGFARIALGTLLYEANRLDESRREMERGFQDAEILGFARFMLGQASGTLAQVRAATGALELARKAGAAGAEHARALGMAPSLPQAGAIGAELALRRGDLDAAAAWAESQLAEPRAATHLIPRMRFLRDTTLARVLLALNRPDDALEVLQGFRTIAREGHAVAFLVTISALEAVAHERAGRPTEAALAVERAIALAAPSGYVRRLVEDGRPVASLIAAVRPSAPELVDAVLAGLGGSGQPAPGQPAPGQPAPGQPAPGQPARGPAPGRRAPGRRAPRRPGLIEPLTARELEVLRLMAQGRTNAAIADELVVSLATAKWHVSHVLAKLAATNRTDALVRAQRLGLV